MNTIDSIFRSKIDRHKVHGCAAWATGLVFLTFLAMIHGAAATPLDDPQAEAWYQEGRSLYSQVACTEESLDAALALFKRANERAPSAFKVTFAIGAVHWDLREPDAASKWFRQALDLAASDSERQRAAEALDEAEREVKRLEAMTARVHWSFRMKEGGVDEPPSGAFSLKAGVFPKVSVDGDWQNLIETVTRAIPECGMYRKPPYLVVSLPGANQAEQLYRRGIEDFDRYFSKNFFVPEFTSPLVIIIGANAHTVAGGIQALFPEVHLQSDSLPFLGLYDAGNNAIFGTSGDYGYGTLHHELVHAYIENREKTCPAWFEETMASLYERTQWDGEEYCPLVNWRMGGIYLDQLPALAEFADEAASFNPKFNIAETRLLFMFLARKGYLSELYERGRKAGDSGAFGPLFAHHELKDEDWQAFAKAQREEYFKEDNGYQQENAVIKQAQRMLNGVAGEEIRAELGHDLDTDGLFGKNTIKAIRLFQQTVGLPVNGALNDTTLNALRHRYVERLMEK